MWWVNSNRAISTVIGVTILVVIVLLLVVAAGFAVTGLSENALQSAAVHSQANYDVQIENRADKKLRLRLRNFKEHDPETEFLLQVNDRNLFRWDGQSELTGECLYPGDSLTVVSVNGDTRYIAEEYTVENPTDCTTYNTFRKKFEYGVFNGDSYAIRDEYDFGLAIDPNGDDIATEHNGPKDLDVGKIPLSNDWHYVERYDRNVSGLSPPVFVVVMVDNVHWSDVPDATLTNVPSGEYYNWTDSPPSGLDPGSNSFTVNGGTVETNSTDATEPTNDIYFAFKPGCDESTLKFIDESAGYDNDIYLKGTKIIDNTNSVSNSTFDAPGVECPEGASW